MTSKKNKAMKREKYRKLIEKNEGKAYADDYFNSIEKQKVEEKKKF